MPSPTTPEPSGFDDPLYPQAAAMLPADEAMPVSFLQRRFHIGYHRA
jgi:DNA segregation ATPase FtsK/SpoIIIE-like protein